MTHRASSNSEADPVLVSLLAEPVRVASPAHQKVPFVFASPHSGRLYPRSLLARSRLCALSLRRSEDAYVDELFDTAAELGAPLLHARFPRAYLDANRAPAELDSSMFEGALALPVDSESPRVHAGLGIIPRVVREGVEIYGHRLPAREAEDRIRNFYRPYHNRLGRLIAETRARFGIAVLVDCHSMPSGTAAPDVILGDRLGLAAAAAVTYAAEYAFSKQGFRVGRNTPYAGGHSTQFYGRPGAGVHALQIEVNRALYLDEERVEKSRGFESTRRRIAAALRDLIAFSAHKPASAARLAAE